MTQMRLYNTLTNREEPIVPIDPAGRRILFYSCGPTVYDYAHIGNFRSFLNADLLRRTLELLGYEVHHVMNITDVGHMTDDDVADGGGEDKMAAAGRRLLEAKKSGKLPTDAGNVDPNDPLAIAQFYADAFLDDAQMLGMKVAIEEIADAATRWADARSPIMPRPTQYIPEMIALVEKLIDRGHAYVGSDGVVYFDVQSYADYGSLSGNTPDAIRSGEGGRVNEATQAIKKHPADFMLWKADPTHLMRWPSPWGEGYPGWHLECSVMAETLLGQETGGVIDIHSGGEDNIFPHHECERAQSCCGSGQSFFAHHWFHTRFLIVEGEKMSKSKGNFYTVRDLIARHASPAAIRLELIKTHYRSNANFTMQGLSESERRIERWRHLLDALHERVDSEAKDGDAIDDVLEVARSEFVQSLSNDLNVSGALGALDKLCGRLDVSSLTAGAAQRAIDQLVEMITTLGLNHPKSSAAPGNWFLPAAAVEHADEAEILTRIAQRNAARQAKDWAASDRLRDELQQMGVAIKDGPEGTTWTRIVK